MGATLSRKPTLKWGAEYCIRGLVVGGLRHTTDMADAHGARAVVSWRDAEKNAAHWMRMWGFKDAHVTGPGSDGGVDVRATGALAQVKMEAQPTGRPVVQRLVGARGRDISMRLFFFTAAGYSRSAVTYANELRVALFRYDTLGHVVAVNGAAQRILDAARLPTPGPPHHEPGMTVIEASDPEDLDEFFFRASLADVARALHQMNRMDGGEHRLASEHAGGSVRMTIAPGWVREYAGLVSFTAEVRYVERGSCPLVRLRWSSYSAQTTEGRRSLDRVIDDAAVGIERAHDLLTQLLGEPDVRPRPRHTPPRPDPSRPSRRRWFGAWSRP
ncbi:hypothetical protein GCM10027215_20630 [Nocardioides zeae]